MALNGANWTLADAAPVNPSLTIGDYIANVHLIPIYGMRIEWHGPYARPPSGLALSAPIAVHRLVHWFRLPKLMRDKLGPRSAHHPPVVDVCFWPTPDPLLLGAGSGKTNIQPVTLTN